MARRDTAARRYAEAAFEVALRDDTVDDVASELDAAAAIVADELLARPGQPGRPPRGALGWPPKDLRELVGRPVLNLIGLMLRRGRIEELPPHRRGVPPARQRAAGHRPRHRTSAAPLTDRGDPGRRRADGAVHRRSRRARRPGRSQPAGRPRRSGRRPNDRRERPRPPRATAESARFGRPLGDLRPMAIRSDEITSIIKSAIDSFDAGVETRSVGTVVEVGDGIAQIYGLAGALSSELLEFPGGLMGMALNLEEETVGAVILGNATGDQGRRHGQDDRPRRRGAGRRRRCSAASSTRSAGRSTTRARSPRRRPARSSASPRASSSASRSTRRSRPASRRSTR